MLRLCTNLPKKYNEAANCSNASAYSNERTECCVSLGQSEGCYINRLVNWDCELTLVPLYSHVVSRGDTFCMLVMFAHLCPMLWTEETNSSL
jgi:hypothetical protein